MRDPLTPMLLRGAGRDPRDCRTEAELESAMHEMAARSQEDADDLVAGARHLLGRLELMTRLAQ